jgi:hypothetical protein
VVVAASPPLELELFALLLLLALWELVLAALPPPSPDTSGSLLEQFRMANGMAAKARYRALRVSLSVMVRIGA